MPDPREYKAGSSSLVLGVDSYTSPAELGDSEYLMGQNVVCRGGIVQTRPGSRTLFCLPDGNFQGCTLFTPANGVAHLVFAVNGSVYVSAAPFATYRRLWTLQFSLTAQYMAWAICLKSTDYDVEGNLIFLDNPYSVLMMQDGLTRAAYWDGSTAAHINPGPTADNTDTPTAGFQGTPVGLWMIWSGNRLWVSRGNQIYASDIGNPLKFTEAQYINEGRAFYLTGPCTGMVEVPSGQGEDKGFIAFTENDGTLFQSYIQDRTAWLATPLFQNTILPNIGCVAPRSLVTQYGLNWWFSARGLTNLNAAFRQNLSSRIDYQDNQMMSSKAYLSPNLSGVCGSFYENYLMMSVPSGDVLNRHTWVLDQAPMEGNVNAWTGFWTGWRPIEWCRGIVNGDERIFFGSVDYDGKNRIWEAMLDEKKDNGCPITCYAQLRDHAFGDLDLKKYDWSKFFLSQILGEVHLNVYVASTKGAYQLQKNYKIVATEGQIYADQQYSENGPLMIGNRVQSRTIRTPSSLEDNECNSCGVESKVGNKIDYAFTHLLVWSGIMGIRAYQLYAHEEPDRIEGDCEEPEEGPRVLNAQGCSGMELFVDGQVFAEYTGYAEGTARLNNGTLAYIRQEKVSVISQSDADRLASCAVAQTQNAVAGQDVPGGVYNLGSAVVGEGSYMIVQSDPDVTDNPEPPPEELLADILIVAGGGGGGSLYAGGGGGGEVVEQSAVLLDEFTTYPVVVGAGGTGAANRNVNGTAGGNSSFNGTTMTGGAFGGSLIANSGDGGNGVTGGGAAGTNPASSGGSGSQGGNGGIGSNNGVSNAAGGGGGGIAGGGGGDGQNAPSSTIGGAGGNGVESLLSGSSVTYGGGGGGGSNGTGGSGTDGGGNGGSGTIGGDAPANRGGGGGGSGWNGVSDQRGGNGGSGVVIVSYPGSPRFSGGTITSAGGNTIHTFTSSADLAPL